MNNGTHIFNELRKIMEVIDNVNASKEKSMNNDIIKTFTTEQIDFVVELYTNNKYSFDTTIRTLALYANMTDTDEIVKTAIANNESMLMAVRDVKNVLGCHLITAKALVDAHRNTQK